MLFVRPSQGKGRNWEGRPVLSYDERYDNVEVAVGILSATFAQGASLKGCRRLVRRLNRVMLLTDSCSCSVGEILAKRKGVGAVPYLTHSDSSHRLYQLYGDRSSAA